MKKFLMIVGVIFLLLIGLVEAVLPRIGSGALDVAIRNALKTDTVEVNARTFPACLMLFGRIGNIDVTAENGMLGNLRASKLTLHGEGVQMPPDVLMNHNFAVSGADVMTLEGVVTADDLADFLNHEIKEIEDAKVAITKEQVIVDAKTKIMGRSADVHLEGVFFVEDNKIALRLTNVKVKKIFFGRDLTANFFERIDLYDFNRLNMPVELDEAVHEDGQVLLKASRHPGKTYGDGRKPEKKGDKA
ncbi:MAG: DUF2993 domain-containing protein [Schwartzia sp.]|nr:DUF2993 domain-containing protein [Schwartzia sp. (in: firmicutes)]